MRLNLQAHNVHASGYGRFGVEMAKALEALGVDNAGDIGMETEGYVGDVTVPFDTKTTDLQRVALWLSTPCHVRGWYEGQFAAIFTMWESTDMPEGFRHNLHNFDRILVPSLQNVELFSRFHPDVRYVPLGINSEDWHYTPRQPVGREFRFFSAGYGPRKGCDMVAAAFRKVFPRGEAPTRLGPVPRLILRSRDDIVGPGITTIPHNVSRAGEIDLYATAHCYVSGSKGEGWGFMPMQAIAQGCPTILGADHGHLAFAHYSIPIDTHPFRCERATFWGDGGYWWEPDFDQMCEAMWDVYNDYESYLAPAAANAQALTTEFTWEASATGVILELADQWGQAAPRGRVWKGATPRLFHIRVNKAVTYTVNGVDHAFLPGHDYYEAADLKRAVMAAGHLDMETFDPNDLGMEDNVVPAELRARNSICPTCRNPFNRDETLRELVGGLQ